MKELPLKPKLDDYLRGMMSRVAKKTRRWISETAVRNSADLN